MRLLIASWGSILRVPSVCIQVSLPRQQQNVISVLGYLESLYSASTPPLLNYLHPFRPFQPNQETTWTSWPTRLVTYLHVYIISNNHNTLQPDLTTFHLFQSRRLYTRARLRTIVGNVSFFISLSLSFSLLQPPLPSHSLMYRKYETICIVYNSTHPFPMPPILDVYYLSIYPAFPL